MKSSKKDTRSKQIRKEGKMKQLKKIFFIAFTALLAAAVTGVAKKAPVRCSAAAIAAEEQTAGSYGNFNAGQIPEYTGSPSVDVNDDIPFFKDSELKTKPYEEYGPFDALGRCTYAKACVGPETMPTEERGPIGMVKPTGWHTVKYEGIDGRYLYNRCHLIGFQLTGENDNEQNLITGTRYMNIEGMLPFENSVAEYVRGTKNHVLYRVTPIFDGNDLVCRGVLMEAESVEDPIVRFCVFCYNVQPGIEIDYSTGESRKAGDEEKEEHDEDKKEYVLNVNTKRFHVPSCSSVQKMKEKNKKEITAKRQDLIDMGYSPCGACNP